MPRINVLPREVYELIAAGEVVERPASAIREMTENSVDSGATSVTVEIKNGGVSFMRVTDNGCGIAPPDVRAAFKSHATSKIASARDLDAIRTLGFRGEALASIAAVSRVEMLTRTPDSPIGTRYEIEGGRETLFEEAGCPVGTTVIVRDLFFNTPARMKFLKKDATEATNVRDVLARIALAGPDVSIRLISDNRQVFFTPGDSRLITVITELFGRDFAAGLIPVAGSQNGVNIDGFVSKPVFSRPNRRMQYFLLNGRFVRIPAAQAALDNAYKNSAMAGKYPSCVLNIGVDPASVDVNVHPAKTEVRFGNEKLIYDAVYFAAVTALREGDTVPVTKLETKEPRREDVFVPRAERTAPPQPEIKSELSMSLEPGAGQETPLVSDLYAGAVRREERRRQVATLRDTSSVFETVREDDDAVLNMRPVPAAPAPQRQPEQLEIAEAKSLPFRIVGEVFGTYIIAERGGKLIFVDKHAAHERILFNRIKARSGNAGAQALLSPVMVTLPAKDYSCVMDNLDLFEQAGYKIADFGVPTVRVTECPVELTGEDVASLVLEFADQLTRMSAEPEPVKLSWLYNSTACRAAVKAGDRLSTPEMEELVNTVLSDDDVRYCPHGRPVMFELGENELKKLFGRDG
ncbi:MAG: DNA mismatch repair endonuclease MutL [Clostridia bacterium]|nr:DNA mismatch repair endonuclease MutL [Clostridia bacterium]